MGIQKHSKMEIRVVEASDFKGVLEVILWRPYGDFLKSCGKLNTTTLQFGDDSAIHF